MPIPRLVQILSALSLVSVLILTTGCVTHQEDKLVGKWRVATRVAMPSWIESDETVFGFDLRDDHSLKTHGIVRQSIEPKTEEIDGELRVQGGYTAEEIQREGEWVRAEDELILFLPDTNGKKWDTEVMTIRALTSNFLILEDGGLAGVFRRIED